MSSHWVPNKTQYRLMVASALIVLAGLAILFVRCGSPQSHDAKSPVNCADGSAPGTIRPGSCPAGLYGAYTQVCTNAGAWQEATNTCGGTPPCGKVLFPTVQPILVGSCAIVGCHTTPNIADYSVAKPWASEISRRIVLPEGNNAHMPKGNIPALQAGDTALLQKWVSDGALNTCADVSTIANYSLSYVQDAIVQNAQQLPTNDDRSNIVYLVMADAANAGLSADVQKTWVQAINKALNGLNATGRDLIKVDQVDPAGMIWRFDARSLGWNQADLAAIAQADLLGIVDNTVKGQVLAALTGRAQSWFYVDDFLDIAYRNSAVYYRLLRIPGTLAALQTQIGVNFADSLGRDDANFVGIDFSPTGISENKNRLLVRVDQTQTKNAYYWQSFDVANAAKTLALTPLLPGTNATKGVASVENLIADAGEIIFSLPNGMQAYALVNAKGVIINSADPAVVRDPDSPVAVGSVINVANSCVRCHHAGIIAGRDFVLDYFSTHAFPVANDVLIVKAVYHPAGSNAAMFNRDNSLHGAALQAIGLDAAAPDPMSVVTDRYLEPWTLTMLASKVHLTNDQTALAIQQSADTRAALGPLTQNSTVPFDVIRANLKKFLADNGIFQNPLGQ
jgi:hypothetical protein